MIVYVYIYLSVVKYYPFKNQIDIDLIRYRSTTVKMIADCPSPYRIFINVNLEI